MLSAATTASAIIDGLVVSSPRTTGAGTDTSLEYASGRSSNVKTLIPLVLAIAGGLVLCGAAVLIAQPNSLSSPEAIESAQKAPVTNKDLGVTVTPEMKEHSRLLDILYFVTFLYGLAVTVLILATGLSRRMRDAAFRATNRKFVAAMLYFVLFSLVSALLTFPLDWYSGFSVPHRFDLSNQTFGEWFLEQLKQFGISILIAAPLVALALMGIRKMPRRWWLALWLGTIPVTLLLVLAQPLIIDPIFNKFEPLKNQVLAQRLLDTAAKAGISGGRVYEVNKSKQTKTMNAYVNGIGPSKRIVMWDTLLAKMTEDEVVFVMGHEMGHYVMHHLWKGIAFTMAVLFFVFFAAKKLLDLALIRFGPAWGLSEPSDPATVPLLFLVLSLITFALSPVFAGYSRSVEHQADIFALELTRLNEPGARAFIKFAEDTKLDPEPNRFIEIWRYSHPALARRIAFALAYKPWERGEPNRLWKGK